MTTLTRPTENNRRLAEHAEEIRKYQERTFENIVAIGRHLIAAKQLAGPGNWLSWLEQNFGWSDRTARRLIQVAVNRTSLSNLNMPISALYQLTAPGTPPAARDAVIAKAKAERVTHRQVTELVRAAKPIVERPRLVAAQPVRTEPAPLIEHTPPPAAELPNFLLFVSRVEANSSYVFKRTEDEWRAAIAHRSDMPAELRDRLLDCLNDLVEKTVEMISVFEVPTRH